MTAAAEAANVSRASVYAWKAADPEFADAWEEALQLGVAGLEDRALELAMMGNDRLIMFLLTARKPEIYGQRSSVEITGSLSLALRRAPIEELRAELAQLLAGRPAVLPVADLTPLDHS